jgi:hypothetical protein
MNASRDGEIGRRSGLKIRRSERTVGVRFPLPAPAKLWEIAGIARKRWILAWHRPCHKAVAPWTELSSAAAPSERLICRCDPKLGLEPIEFVPNLLESFLGSLEYVSRQPDICSYCVP